MLVMTQNVESFNDLRESYFLMIFSLFTELCNHHHSQYKDTSITPKRNSLPISSHSSFSPPPAPGNHKFTFCLFGLAYSM